MNSNGQISVSAHREKFSNPFPTRDTERQVQSQQTYYENLMRQREQEFSQRERSYENENRRHRGEVSRWQSNYNNCLNNRSRQRNSYRQRQAPTRQRTTNNRNNQQNRRPTVVVKRRPETNNQKRTQPQSDQGQDTHYIGNVEKLRGLQEKPPSPKATPQNTPETPTQEVKSFVQVDIFTDDSEQGHGQSGAVGDESYDDEDEYFELDLVNEEMLY